MSEHFLVTLKEFRRIHTIYMVTFGLLLLNVVANPRVSDEDGMVIFGVAAVWHRYSLVIDTRPKCIWSICRGFCHHSGYLKPNT